MVGIFERAKYIDLMTFMHAKQFLHMEKHMIAYRSTPTCDLGVLAEWAFTGKTPAEAMPNGEAERAARRLEEADFTGLAIFHQLSQRRPGRFGVFWSL